MYNWIILSYSKKLWTIVNQLYFNKRKKKKKRQGKEVQKLSKGQGISEPFTEPSQELSNHFVLMHFSPLIYLILSGQGFMCHNNRAYIQEKKNEKNFVPWDTFAKLWERAKQLNSPIPENNNLLGFSKRIIGC